MRYGGSGEGTYGGAGRLFPSPTFTGQSGFANGTGAAPSITFTSDTDTGIYRLAENEGAFSAGGGRSFAWGNGNLTMDAAAILNWGTSAFSAADVGMARVGANGFVFGTGAVASGAVTSRAEVNKAVAAFTNAAAKATFTVTVPNAAHNATLEFRVMGALGAGGAIGAGEAMATNTYVIGIVRTAGVATVATATAAFGAVAVAVAGAATVTATAAVSAMTGAVGATQTFTIDVTITRSGGTSDNHTALCYAKLLNANATGITIA